jgi:phage-related protein
MSVIINDFSLTGQFNKEEEFLDSLVDETLPMFKVIQNLGMNILAGHESYLLRVTKEKTLIQFMRLTGSTEIVRLKSLLNAPYWEDEPLSDNKSIYECSYTEKTNTYCLAEALERNIIVMSFNHPEFKESVIAIKKDDNEEYIPNSYNKFILMDILREKGIIDVVSYLIDKHKLDDSFGVTIGKNYFQELCEEAHLSKEDIDFIAADMEKLIRFTENGENSGRLSDTIEGKLKEFRTSLSAKREIRIFYFEVDRKITFLNGFLKKRQTTPPGEIDKAKIIMKRISNQ